MWMLQLEQLDAVNPASDRIVAPERPFILREKVILSSGNGGLLLHVSVGHNSPAAYSPLSGPAQLTKDISSP